MIEKIKEFLLVVAAGITLLGAILMVLAPQTISWPVIMIWAPFAFYFAVHLPNEDANEME